MTSEDVKNVEIERRNKAYLTALKRVHRESISKSVIPAEMLPPRERHRNRKRKEHTFVMKNVTGSWSDIHEAKRVAVMASLVPDEIIYNHSDYAVRSYETALMFIDVSGFTDLCETYTKAGQGGPSRLTQVLNLYIGAMVQEILTHKGDVLKFSGDAFLCMWKKSPKLNMQDVVHTAIDCGLLIQKNYGRYLTDVGVVLKVKIAISAGLSHFSIIGGHADHCQSHYVIVGQPVWDVKMAEYMSTAGDVLTSASAWMYVNESEYCTQPCGDGRHTKVLGVGATWKRVQKLHSSVSVHTDPVLLKTCPESTSPKDGSPVTGINYREFSLRPAVITAMRSDWWAALRRYMVPPIVRAVDNDEPMDFLTEIRHVVVVFLNIITRTVTEDVLIEVVDNAYKIVCSVTSKTGGLVNKVSMFDKDMMFLMVFGLRGLKHEDEAQNALLCANKLKEHLNDVNITTVSVGVTSGSTYCGVVGHVLRREYTVIGSAVNKAARLMMAYPDKVTCDKETFLRSKLDQDFFKLMAAKVLKGFSNPGPIYEFNRSSSKRVSYSHPILGRDEELQIYQTTLSSAIEQYSRKFTRYRDHKFGVAIIGSRLSGKTRLLTECINVTPKFVEVDHITLTEKDYKGPYQVIRLMTGKLLKGIGPSSRENRESRIRFIVDMTSLTPLEINAVNTIFDCRFPLPERFECNDDILNEYQVKVLLQSIFESIFKDFRVIAIGEAQYIDDESWKLLILLLQYKIIFLLLTITDEDSLSPLTRDSLSTHMIVKVHIAGIDRRYLSALACQLLDVQAVPSELDKVIESASDGLPGWIHNFLICLVQREQLTMVTVPRSQALDTGALVPPATLLKRSENKQSITSEGFSKHYNRNDISIAGKQQNDVIQMAVLSKYYDFDDIKVDMKMDVLILKTYDSLTPFEKMLLKCGSVLGDVFSRRMLLHLMQCDSQKVALAVAKLFSIRVLECEGGDFTRDYSKVLVHPAPVQKNARLPSCFCMGIKQLSNSSDLPMYAFCGYMKFRHTLFRTTTYDLLTECQKGEMHTRALLYLERYTRKCVTCGAGCFSRLFGLRCDDGLKKESDELKLTHDQIRTMNAETKISEGNIYAALQNITDNASSGRRTSNKITDSEADLRRVSRSMQNRQDTKIPSFSSVDLKNCECMFILLAAYSQAIGHCHWAGDREKLFDTYLEYADLSLLNANTPRAIHLLSEVETMLTNDRCSKGSCTRWIYDYKLARIYSLRGACLLECGDLKQTRESLFYAMKLFSDPFPESNNSLKFRNCKCSFSQLMALYVAPRMYVACESGLIGDFYERIAWTLNRLFKLFTVCKEISNASLAAKWSLNYALKTDSNFRLLCMSYGNMISVYRQMKKFRLCGRLETKARELCQRKCGRVDIIEVHAVGHLYTNIFLYNVQRGKKLESLEFGLSVLPMMTSLSDVSTRESLIFWILKLLLTELRVHQMVSIMKEFIYLNEHYDVSCEVWYYYNAMTIYLDTGYCVESYRACETFYMEKGEMFLRSKTPEAAWNFFACMWLFSIRVGLWEKSVIWYEKIEQIQHMDCTNHEYYTSIMLRLVEGYLIELVRELNNRNIKNVINIAKSLKTLFSALDVACKHIPIFRSRFYLFDAYYNYIKRKKQRAFNLLNKATQSARKYSDKLMIIWIEHNRLYWKCALNPRLENYWSEHVESYILLNYKSFDEETGRKIIPFTLPLPKIF